MGVLAGLEPKVFFDRFEEISAIPRGSYHEEAISNHLKAFAEERGCTVFQDEYYNLLIKVPASKGYENAAPVLFHGHMDMVLDKEPGVEKDMLKEGVDLYIDGDYIKAKGTTLGADNGVGVAFMMCIIDDKTLPHPPIECCISVQEEVGKKGGTVFDPSNVTGKRLMDFNWHKPDTIFAGCAGDISAYFRIPVTENAPAEDAVFYELAIAGGLGGHSEFDINLERVNALQAFGRILNKIALEMEVSLTDITAGVNRYVIPGSMEAVLAVSKKDAQKAEEIVAAVAAELKNEYKIADPDIAVTFAPAEEKASVFTYEETKKIAKALRLLPCGVQSMSLEIEGLVESSNTLAMMDTEDGKVWILMTIPSAVTSRRYNILQKVYDLAEILGASVDTFADCPEWPYRPDSKLLATAKKAFYDLYGYEAGVEVSHSSLELGLFCKKIPGLECISLGPKAYDVHTPKERLDWTTVQMVWDHIKEILKDMTE
ncbi:MAG: beta-Ala-His dipeptidase [Lachnospiraceae bacterium]|nr:beta-Ala-His dipeptidase [Lachnospiraceae bacterium]